MRSSTQVINSYRGGPAGRHIAGGGDLHHACRRAGRRISDGRQEDTGDAKVWQHRLRQGDWRVVATVNDSDGESSGIADVSEWFGGGTWLLDVQGHGADVETSFDPETGVTSKLETGQLMLLKIPHPDWSSR